MSGQIFKQAQWDLGKLVNFIELGVIGLPDIQRPFVWPTRKFVTCSSGIIFVEEQHEVERNRIGWKML